MPYFLLLGNPIQKWHWQVVVKFNRATKLNIQAIFRGVYYVVILSGGNTTILPFFRGGGIPLYSHFSGGKSYYIVIFPWGKTGYGGGGDGSITPL
jgi:hypothetical protein